MRHGAFLSVFAALLCLGMCQAQDDTYTDPDKAGPDYLDQGENAGKIGDQNYGAQIIALGNDKFDMVLYEGGLPGDGWKRGDSRKRASGQRADDEVAFRGDFQATLRERTLEVELNGKKGVLERVHRKSPTLGKAPPEGAVVLFRGKSADAWANGETTPEGHLMANTESKRKFGDHTLHVEFRTPFKPFARGQARGNSGVYIQGRYELQVLDSFGLEGENNECGGIYSIAKPDVNMCYPPLTWQTYDIDFQAARWDDNGNKTRSARVTIRHNGVVIHDDLELPHGTPGKYPERPGDGPIYLQGHGNPVVYKNIWVVEK